MMGCGARWEGGQQRGNLRGEKKNVITYRLDELISNDIHWFCMTAAKTHSIMAESKGVLLMARQRGLSFTESGFHHTKRGEGASDTSTKHGGLPVWAPDIHKARDMCSISSSCKVPIVPLASASESV